MQDISKWREDERKRVIRIHYIGWAIASVFFWVLWVIVPVAVGIIHQSVLFAVVALCAGGFIWLFILITIAAFMPFHPDTNFWGPKPID